MSQRNETYGRSGVVDAITAAFNLIFNGGRFHTNHISRHFVPIFPITTIDRVIGIDPNGPNFIITRIAFSFVLFWTAESNFKIGTWFTIRLFVIQAPETMV